MSDYLSEFTQYLKQERKLSGNTLLAYGRDLSEFQDFITERQFPAIEDVGNTEVVAYLLHLKNGEKSTATINRKLASIRSFFSYLVACGHRTEDPTKAIRSPRAERKSVDYLTLKEVENLLTREDLSFRGLRDKALLELLYASGMRASEATAANVEDVNLRIGFIVAGTARGKARLIPLGRPARAAIENYLAEGRPKLIRDKSKDEKALFLNYNGERLTRQGIWKLLKEYGADAGLTHTLTPQILRNSFAVHMVQNGADLKTLQELLGCEDIMATQIYLSADKKKIKDVYDKTHPRA
jgi:integrase/recombinase XerD